MKFPDFLQKNGTIGLVAPSFGCSEDPYLTCMQEAEKYFEGQGYHVVEGPNCRKNEGIGISSTPYNCGHELTDFYCSDKNDILLTCGGGELMCETIDHVDFEQIKAAKPKWYMGYSDNTNFTFLLNTLCDVASIYGPSIGAFGTEKFHQAHIDALGIITGTKLAVEGYESFELESFKDDTNPRASYNLTEQKQYRYYIGEKEVTGADMTSMKGRLTGGCLDCLANLVGTKYDEVASFNSRYADDGIIWFLECCDLTVLSMRRSLWNLDRAGWFKNAAGFIIGRPMAAYGQEIMGLDQYSAVTGILGKYNVPIIMDADIGHLPPAMPLISGAYTRVSVRADNLHIDFEL